MQSGELSPRPGAPRRRPGPDDPLRIAYLTYRGKPHVGGQGVYTRHLSKALVDLGHHVEVLSGQPYPIVDERVPLIELPSLDIYNDYFPMRMPAFWELKDRWDWAEVTAFSTCSIEGSDSSSSRRHGPHMPIGMRTEPYRYSLPSVATEKTFGTNSSGTFCS